MILTIVIVFFSLIGLIVLHELGHFIIAKRLGVKVEEFGIGYPPRLFGKKFGETIYSLNLIPFGAFVRIKGEDGEGSIEDYQSFASRPIWQRMLIVFGGVLSFWIIAAVLLSLVMRFGVSIAVSDENQTVLNPRVQIVAVAPHSPAEKAGIKIGDIIRGFKINDSEIKIDKVKSLQDLVQKYKGQEVVLVINRGGKLFEAGLTPRVSPPEGEGAIGIVLARTAIVKYSWWRAPVEGIKSTVRLTFSVVEGLIQTGERLLQKKGLPPGSQLLGPIGIGSLMVQVAQMGINYYLQFVAMISIYLAVFNILPIPALDGGKMVFLLIEGIRKKPINQKVEQNITIFFFALLIILMIWVTIKDIQRLL